MQLDFTSFFLGGLCLLLLDLVLVGIFFCACSRLSRDPVSVRTVRGSSRASFDEGVPALWDSQRGWQVLPKVRSTGTVLPDKPTTL